MRKTEKRTKTSEWEVVVELKCDLCGKKAKQPGNDWAEGYYDKSEVEVLVRSEGGEVYPDCGDTKQVFFDICPACFFEKLVPWLASHGATPQESTSTY